MLHPDINAALARHLVKERTRSAEAVHRFGAGRLRRRRVRRPGEGDTIR